MIKPGTEQLCLTLIFALLNYDHSIYVTQASHTVVHSPNNTDYPQKKYDIVPGGLESIYSL